MQQILINVKKKKREIDEVMIKVKGFYLSN